MHHRTCKRKRFVDDRRTSLQKTKRSRTEEQDSVFIEIMLKLLLVVKTREWVTESMPSAHVFADLFRRIDLLVDSFIEEIHNVENIDQIERESQAILSGIPCLDNLGFQNDIVVMIDVTARLESLFPKSRAQRCIKLIRGALFQCYSLLQ